MYITWLGQSCFKLQDKQGSDGITVVTDPFESEFVGLKMPSFEANIITVSHNHRDHNNVKALRGNPFIINSAGEYDVNGVMFEGIDSAHSSEETPSLGRNIIFRIEMDNITLAHLGDLGETLNDKQLERLVGVDILMVPVGGKYTLDAKKAMEVISQIEPRIVIPMHYKVPGLKVDIDEVDKFIKEIGVNPTYEEKLKISQKDLPQEDMELVILKI